MGGARRLLLGAVVGVPPAAAVEYVPLDLATGGTCPFKNSNTGYIPHYIGSEWEAKSAAEKVDELWAMITADPTPSLVGPNGQPDFGAALDQAGQVGQCTDPNFQKRMWTDIGDEHETRRMKIHPHRNGMVCKAKWTSTTDPPHGYTGMFEHGCEHMLIRFSMNNLLMPPYMPKFMRVQFMINGLYFKCLRDGIPSWNIGGFPGFVPGSTQPAALLRDDWTNHMKDYNYTRGGDMMEIGVLDSLKAIMPGPAPHAGRIGLLGAAHYNPDGGAREPEPVFPFRITGHPPKALSDAAAEQRGLVEALEASAGPNATQTSVQLMSDQFRDVAAGTKLYDMYAYADPTSTTPDLVGSIEATSECVSSAFGDSDLFFQHHYFHPDVAMRPDWAAAIEEIDRAEAAAWPHAESYVKDNLPWNADGTPWRAGEPLAPRNPVPAPPEAAVRTCGGDGRCTYADVLPGVSVAYTLGAQGGRTEVSATWGGGAAGAGGWLAVAFPERVGYMAPAVAIIAGVLELGGADEVAAFDVQGKSVVQVLGNRLASPPAHIHDMSVERRDGGITVSFAIDEDARPGHGTLNVARRAGTDGLMYHGPGGRFPALPLSDAVPTPEPAPTLCRPSDVARAPGEAATFDCRLDVGSVPGVSLHWTVDAAAEMLHFAVRAPGTGWVGLGFPERAGRMVPADAVIGHAGSDGGEAAGYRLEAQPAEGLDGIQKLAADAAAAWGLSAASAEEVSGATTVRATRRYCGAAGGAACIDPAVPLAINVAYGNEEPPAGKHPLNQMGSLTVSLLSGAASEIDLNEIRDARRTHGALMLTAWMYLAPLAVFFKRYGKPVFGISMSSRRGGIHGLSIGFTLHFTLAVAAVAVTFAGLAVAKRHWWSVGTTGRAKWGHSGIGCTIGACIFIQPAAGLFMSIVAPTADHPLRAPLKYAHHIIGRALLVLSIVQCFLGVKNLQRFDDDTDRFQAAARVGLAWNCVAWAFAELMARGYFVRRKSAVLGLDGDGVRQLVDWDQIGEHVYDDNCWIVIDGKAYDVTPWLDSHPGGPSKLLKYAGTEATGAFNEMRHSEAARARLEAFYVGEVELTRVVNTVCLAEDITNSVVLYDLDRAEDLITEAAKDEMPNGLIDSFNKLVANLRLYRPFLPNALFAEEEDFSDDGLDSPQSAGTKASQNSSAHKSEGADMAKKEKKAIKGKGKRGKAVKKEREQRESMASRGSRRGSVESARSAATGRSDRSDMSHATLKAQQAKAKNTLLGVMKKVPSTIVNAECAVLPKPSDAKEFYDIFIARSADLSRRTRGVVQLVTPTGIVFSWGVAARVPMAEMYACRLSLDMMNRESSWMLSLKYKALSPTAGGDTGGSRVTASGVLSSKISSPPNRGNATTDSRISSPPTKYATTASKISSPPWSAVDASAALDQIVRCGIAKGDSMAGNCGSKAHALIVNIVTGNVASRAAVLARLGEHLGANGPVADRWVEKSSTEWMDARPVDALSGVQFVRTLKTDDVKNSRLPDDAPLPVEPQVVVEILHEKKAGAEDEWMYQLEEVANRKDPLEEYRAGWKAIMAGDRAGAKRSLREHLQQMPDDRVAQRLADTLDVLGDSFPTPYCREVFARPVDFVRVAGEASYGTVPVGIMPKNAPPKP